ncbi:MFS transporter [Streptomyces sp. NPDC001307]|uniref:MFS transporter n=1 Tax=Streptomyces sp. NPDC001307 TaxID=3364560 RepID=UPI0036AC6524
MTASAPRTVAHDDRPSGPTGGIDRGTVLAMVLGSIRNPVNSSMLAVALVPIARGFHTTPAQTAWLVSGLYLATAIGQPVFGRVVDIIGPRTPYLLGAALTGAASLFGALAPNLPLLVLSRILLGLGTSAAYPAAMALVRRQADAFDHDDARRSTTILAILTASSQVVAVLGPTVGGLLISAGGWRLIWAVNLPLVAACLTLGARRLPRYPRPVAPDPSDVRGVALFSATLTLFMLFLMDPTSGHWYLPVLAAAVGTAFTVTSLPTAHPFLDLCVLAGNVPLLATYVRQFLAYLSTYAFLYGFTQWAQASHGLSAAEAGLLLLPLSAAALAATAATGRHPTAFGKLVVGSVLQILGAGILLTLGATTPAVLLVAVGVVMGIPQGINGLGNQNALYVQGDAARMGASAGLLRTFIYVGALTAAANAACFRHGATLAAAGCLYRAAGHVRGR